MAELAVFASGTPRTVRKRCLDFNAAVRLDGYGANSK